LCDRVAIIEHGRIIDMDTPQRLVERHCPERTVALATDDVGAEERFRAMTGVEAVNRNDGRFTIRGRGDDFVSEVDSLPIRESDPGRDFRTILPILKTFF